MTLYPQVPAQRTRTVLGDLLVLGLVVLFAWLGVAVHDTVDQLAVVPEGVTGAGTAVQGGFDRAAEAVEGAPVVGDDLAGGLRGAGGATGGNVAELGREGEERVHRAADFFGLLTFLLPTGLVLLQALPRRFAQVRRLTAANRALESGDDRLLAMRAAFSLPYGELLRYTPDPFGDLAAERYDALVTAAFEAEGLRPRASAASVSVQPSRSPTEGGGT